MTGNESNGSLARYERAEERLFTSVVSDILDNLRLVNRAMTSNIRPIHPDHIVVGRARTMLFMDVYEVTEDPYKVEIEAIDTLQVGDVVVQTTNGSQRIVSWGNLMTTAAIARGARGAIVDGYVRDARQIIAQGFPVFAAGFRPLDSKGRGYMVDYDCPVECGGVLVHTGDLVFADFDGVVVVPQRAEKDVLAQAFEKAAQEKMFLKELRKSRRLRDVYDEYGFL